MMYCKFCGKEISDTEDVCNDCKKLSVKNEKSAKKKNDIFIIITPCLIVLLIAYIIITVNSSNQKDSSIRYNNNLSYNVKENTVNQMITTTPKEIYKDYDNNKISANIKYKDKNISITGKIYVITEDGGTPSIGLVNSDDKYEITIPEVYCSFEDNKQNDKIAKLSKGQVVTIEGILDMAGSSIYIKNCILK
jgi:predicted nucleic acid-binding Zn ribbon protein